MDLASVYEASRDERLENVLEEADALEQQHTATVDRVLLEARPRIGGERFTDSAERWRPAKTEEEKYSTSVAGYGAYGLRKTSGPTALETAWRHVRSAREAEGHTSHLDWDTSRRLHSSREGVHGDIGSASWNAVASGARSTDDGAAGALADDEQAVKSGARCTDSGEQKDTAGADAERQRSAPSAGGSVPGYAEGSDAEQTASERRQCSRG
eukprot:scpid58668/ scgid29633/ 